MIPFLSVITSLARLAIVGQHAAALDKCRPAGGGVDDEPRKVIAKPRA
jgi:hypothetical protein